MNKSVLVIGGCKSGKSSHALMAAESLAKKRLYIATCVPQDDEMKERVKNHKEERDETWSCIEEPLDVIKTIKENSGIAGVILLDCITLWISNILFATPEGRKPEIPVDELITAVNNSKCPVVIVTNEVGAGIVPENKIARQYRDIAGIVNQKLARGITNVTMMIAGIPVKIK